MVQECLSHTSCVAHMYSYNVLLCPAMTGYIYLSIVMLYVNVSKLSVLCVYMAPCLHKLVEAQVRYLEIIKR